MDMYDVAFTVMPNDSIIVVQQKASDISRAVFDAAQTLALTGVDVRTLNFLYVKDITTG